MKKKWLIFTSLVLALALTFAGCGGGEKQEDADKQEQSKVTEGAISEGEEETAENDQAFPQEEALKVSEQQPSQQKTEAKTEQKAKQKSGTTTKTQQTGGSTDQAQTQPVQTQPESVPEAQTASVPQPEQVPEPAAPSVPTKGDASAYIGSSKSALVSGIGSPNSSSYAPSCIGEGEDGELHYNGFTVYTYRENGSETVTDVL